MKKLSYVFYLVLVCVFCIGCDTHDNYIKNHGNPIYKVTLLNANGNILDVKYAHSKRESWDWGMHKNYEFRYWYFQYYRNSDKWGESRLDTWEWNKDRVIIERGNYAH